MVRESRLAAGLHRSATRQITMANASVSQQEIHSDQWMPVLTTLTREFRGAHARLEVLGSDGEYQVEAEDRPFDGISVDSKDGERVVWISFGPTPDRHLTHGVHDVSAIYMRTTDTAGGAAVEVRSSDGTRTILTLEAPGAHELAAR
jgi:hypothetical protein